MLSNHLARLQCYFGQGQEPGVHTLWFPCRFLLGKRHHSSQARRVELDQVQIPDRLISKERSKGPGIESCLISVVLLVVHP
jgi:hypothetical protein